MSNVLNYSAARLARTPTRSPDLTILVSVGLIAAALIIVVLSSLYSTGDTDALALMNAYP